MVIKFKVIYVILMKLFYTVYCLNTRGGKYISHEDVAVLMKQSLTQQYIAGFNNSFQRLVLTRQLERCPYMPLCNFSFGLPSKISCCEECECSFPQCMMRQTCCPDVMFHNLDISDGGMITGSDLRFIEGIDSQKSCITLTLSKTWTFNRKGTGVLGYASCKFGTSEKLVFNCTKSYSSEIETFEDITPVVSKRTNLVYRNKYCAYCHNVEKENLKYLRKKFLCKSVPEEGSERKLIKEIFDKGTCELHFVSRNLSDMCTVTVNKCNTTELWNFYDTQIESACALYKSVFEEKDESKFFKNVFCSECNGIIKSNLYCELNGHTEGKNGFSFSGLLRLDSTQQPTTDHSINRCKNDEIYDSLSGVCRKMFCPVNMELKQDKCLDIFDYLENVIYSAILRVVPLQMMTKDDAIIDTVHVYNYVSLLISSLGHICNVQVMLQTNIEFNRTNFNKNDQHADNAGFVFYDFSVEFLVEIEHDPKEIIQSLRSRNFTIYDGITSFEYIVIDGNEKVFDLISLIYSTNNDDSITYNDKTDNAREYKRRMIREFPITGFKNLLAFPYFSSIKHDTEKCTYKQNTLKIIRLQPCPKVKLSSSEFRWRENIKSIVLQPGDLILSRNDFYFHDQNTIMVCVRDVIDLITSASLPVSLSLSKSTILSLVCSSLSIICLTATFITFSILSQMRQTVPGKNNMCLVFSMLIANVLYMISGLHILDKDSTGCLILGIFVHFFWLKAIIWMSICTFHMFRVLSRLKMLSKDSGTKRILSYNLFAMFIAVCFVSINVSVSHFRTGSIGYGGQNCYISSQNMINFTFVLPSAIAVFSNIFMFVFVVIKIERTSNVQKHVQNERRNMEVFVKLSTITGITWIFGLLYTWTNVSVLSYIFIILNASQGVFIMLAFVINKRVLNLIKSYSNDSTYNGTSMTSRTSITTKY